MWHTDEDLLNAKKSPTVFLFYFFVPPHAYLSAGLLIEFLKNDHFCKHRDFFSLFLPSNSPPLSSPAYFFFNPWNGTRPSHHFTVKWETCDECQQKSRGTKKCKPSMSIFSFKKHCKSGIIEKYLQYVPPLTVVGFTPLAKKKSKKRRGWGDFWRRKRERVDLLKWR